MHNKLIISAALLSLTFGLSACSTHTGMMKDDMGKEDAMMKEDTMMKNDKMMEKDTMMNDEKGM